MVVYEVNLVVQEAIAPAFEVWLVEHIQEMLALPGFFRARWYQREARDEGREPGPEVLWTVQYDLYTRQDLSRYFIEDAKRMREDGLSRFGDQFSASRRVLTPRSLGGEALSLS